jgi:hypothetical protein
MAVIGLVSRLVVLGEGLFFLNVGRVVYNSNTEQAVFEASEHAQRTLPGDCCRD